MKSLRSPFLWLGLVGLLVALWWVWPRGDSLAAAGGVRSPEVIAETPAPAKASADQVAVAEGRREAEKRPMQKPDEPRPVEVIHKSIMEQARKTVETGAGGADAATKDELIRRTKDIEALGAGGRGFSHPNSILMLAEFSRYLDTFKSFDAAAYKADMTAYFTARLKELDGLPDDGDMAALRAKWQHDLARDDLPEALLLRRVYGDKAQSKSWIERLLADLAR